MAGLLWKRAPALDLIQTTFCHILTACWLLTEWDNFPIGMLYISITNYGFLAMAKIGTSSLILLKIHYLATAHSCVPNKMCINKLGEIMESCIQQIFFVSAFFTSNHFWRLAPLPNGYEMVWKKHEVNNSKPSFYLKVNSRTCIPICGMFEDFQCFSQSFLVMIIGKQMLVVFLGVERPVSRSPDQAKPGTNPTGRTQICTPAYASELTGRGSF